jgi:hypothetical protein
MDERYLRVTVTLGPCDVNDPLLFRWLLGHLIDMHATCPTDMRMRVEVLPPDEPLPERHRHV